MAVQATSQTGSANSVLLPAAPTAPPPLQKTLPYATPRLPKMTIKVSKVTTLVTRLIGHLFQRPSQGQAHEAQSWKKLQRVVLPSDFQSEPQDFRGTSTGPHLPGSTQLVVSYLVSLHLKGF